MGVAECVANFQIDTRRSGVIVHMVVGLRSGGGAAPGEEGVRTSRRWRWRVSGPVG